MESLETGEHEQKDDEYGQQQNQKLCAEQFCEGVEEASWRTAVPGEEL